MCAKPAHAAAGRILHDTAINTENGRTRFGAPDVGIGYVQVVASDRDIEVIFERQRDRVVHRDIEFAIVQKLVDARCVGQVRRRYVARSVGREQVGEGRPGFRVLLHIKRLRLRGHGLLSLHLRRCRRRAGYL